MIKHLHTLITQEDLSLPTIVMSLRQTQPEQMQVPL